MRIRHEVYIVLVVESRIYKITFLKLIVLGAHL
jgi:hypothetical protein